MSQQIDSNVVVIDEDNPTTTTLAEMQGATQPILGSAPPSASEVPLTSPPRTIIRTFDFVKPFNYVFPPFIFYFYFNFVKKNLYLTY